MRDALASGRGAVLATGHVGNWHLGPYFLGQNDLPPITVVMHEEPDPETQRIEASCRRVLARGAPGESYAIASGSAPANREVVRRICALLDEFTEIPTTVLAAARKALLAEK